MKLLRNKRKRNKLLRFLKKSRLTLEYQLLEALAGHVGERGGECGCSEGAVDALYRIIHERDQALLILGLDRLRNFREGRL